MRKRRVAKYALATGIIVACIFFAVLSASPYMTVTQVVEHADELAGARVRVIGEVASPAVSTDYESGTFTFELTDGASTIVVELEIGKRPSVWGKGMRVVVIGELVSRDLIKADQVLTQCRAPPTLE